MVHRIKEKEIRKQLKRTGFDYRFLKWVFVVLLCKVNNGALCFYVKNRATHTVRARHLNNSFIICSFSLLTCKCLALDPALIIINPNYYCEITTMIILNLLDFFTPIHVCIVVMQG